MAENKSIMWAYTTARYTALAVKLREDVGTFGNVSGS